MEVVDFRGGAVVAGQRDRCAMTPQELEAIRLRLEKGKMWRCVEDIRELVAEVDRLNAKLADDACHVPDITSDTGAQD